MAMKFLQQANSIFKDIDAHQDGQVSFVLDSEHFLFDEHFPGFPVVPASLIMEFINLCVAERYTQEGVKFSISNAKFLNPMVPGNTYTCKFKVRSSEALFFSISDDAGKDYNKGIVSFMSESEVEHAA